MDLQKRSSRRPLRSAPRSPAKRSAVKSVNQTASAVDSPFPAPKEEEAVEAPKEGSEDPSTGGTGTGTGGEHQATTSGGSRDHRRSLHILAAALIIVPALVYCWQVVSHLFVGAEWRPIARYVALVSIGAIVGVLKTSKSKFLPPGWPFSSHGRSVTKEEKPPSPVVIRGKMKYRITFPQGDLWKDYFVFLDMETKRLTVQIPPLGSINSNFGSGVATLDANEVVAEGKVMHAKAAFFNSPSSISSGGDRPPEFCLSVTVANPSQPGQVLDLGSDDERLTDRWMSALRASTPSPKKKKKFSVCTQSLPPQLTDVGRRRTAGGALELRASQLGEGQVSRKPEPARAASPDDGLSTEQQPQPSLDTIGFTTLFMVGMYGLIGEAFRGVWFVIMICIFASAVGVIGAGYSPGDTTTSAGGARMEENPPSDQTPDLSPTRHSTTPPPQTRHFAAPPATAPAIPPTTPPRR